MRWKLNRKKEKFLLNLKIVKQAVKSNKRSSINKLAMMETQLDKYVTQKERSKTKNKQFIEFATINQ